MEYLKEQSKFYQRKEIDVDSLVVSKRQDIANLKVDLARMEQDLSDLENIKQ